MDKTVKEKKNDILTHFHAIGLFLELLKTSENLGFLVFSGGIDRD